MRQMNHLGYKEDNKKTSKRFLQSKHKKMLKRTIQNVRVVGSAFHLRTPNQSY